MRQREFYRIVNTNKRAIEFLRESGVLKSHASCVKCGEEMYTDWRDGRFRCKHTVYISVNKKKKKKIQCDTSLSLYDGSWFEGKKAKTRKLLELIYLYVTNNKMTQNDIAYETNMSVKAVRFWCRKINRVLANECNFNNLTKLGGRGVVVEIDESRIGGRKLPRGREVKGQWVFGCIERVTGRSVIVPVPNRSGDTLIPLIQKYVCEQSTIVSDCWTGYKGLLRCDYTYKRVNHKYCFVNPKSGEHTQHIERLWRSLKDYLPDNGIRRNTIEGELSRFNFMRVNSRYQRFETFLRLIKINDLQFR